MTEKSKIAIRLQKKAVDGKYFQEMGILTFEEKKFLLAVERGDVASTGRSDFSTFLRGVNTELEKGDFDHS